MHGRQYPNQAGGLARALAIVGERWTLLIVQQAMVGVSRFEDFHSRIGLSRKTLSVRLVLLVEHGVMTRAPYQQRPVCYDYRLTPNGVALAPALDALTAWGDAHACAVRSRLAAHDFATPTPKARPPSRGGA
jgi:DNA-binding HxlR family transcriptional regulator